MKKVKAIPEGSPQLLAYINVNDAPKAIEFYKKAFGAIETGRLVMPDKTIGHAELMIGDSTLMLSEENKQWNNFSPRTLKGTTVGLCLYVEDVDSVFARAIKEGATVEGGMEVQDQFYGDRSGTCIDPFGHKWTIATHIEDVSWDEMQKRMEAMAANNATS